MANKYKMSKLSGPFGYMENGDGKVIYMFDKELDYDAIQEVVAKVYGEDVSEYDPSSLDSSMAGVLQDELSMQQIAQKIEGDLDASAKFELFVKMDILDNNIPLIYVDTTTKKITQITDTKALQKIIVKNEEAITIFIREYDVCEDY